MLGPSNFTKPAGNDDQDGALLPGTPTARTPASPDGVRVIVNGMFVVDGDTNRVLVGTGS